jgi:hypothetical protein
MIFPLPTKISPVAYLPLLYSELLFVCPRKNPSPKFKFAPAKPLNLWLPQRRIPAFSQNLIVPILLSPSQLSNLKFQISNPQFLPPLSLQAANLFSPRQRFRARANDSSGHAVWPAMRTGENTSAHAKTLRFLPISSPKA